ncbi:hypothetical protein KMZ68_23320 [Bradyrhizobium sediminis]|uniref:Uncharacterized protein n=1 Tax=Bradyrhizobium sediminis TaxID=2840469 RepID=A0A975RRF7_9BRAD|nr:hypothetical protein [Bradyrhizobium sediminis]QWG17847.1 hypothetical protein KMZ68_23320 [Bradyrhizobium sediminis]
MADDNNIERIATKIEALSEAALSARSSYLLSELGKDLGPDLSTLKLLTKKPLSAFIRERFSDKFTVALTGEFKNVQTLIRSPNSLVEQQEQPLLTLSEKFVFETQVSSKPSPRFNYRFWAAFSVPYREGKRFLNLTDFKFQDLTSGDAPEGHVEIPPSFIVAPDIRDRDKLITDNINRWIEENGFDKSDFYQTRPHRESIQTHSNASVLEAVIASLDHRQLSNTSMSLDVVAALMRKRV